MKNILIVLFGLLCCHCNKANKEVEIRDRKVIAKEESKEEDIGYEIEQEVMEDNDCKERRGRYVVNFVKVTGNCESSHTELIDIKSLHGDCYCDDWSNISGCNQKFRCVCVKKARFDRSYRGRIEWQNDGVSGIGYLSLTGITYNNDFCFSEYEIYLSKL